jgi:hypothetical protein
MKSTTLRSGYTVWLYGSAADLPLFGITQDEMKTVKRLKKGLLQTQANS